MALGWEGIMVREGVPNHPHLLYSGEIFCVAKIVDLILSLDYVQPLMWERLEFVHLYNGLSSNYYCQLGN